jgi:hypothetical protein
MVAHGRKDIEDGGSWEERYRRWWLMRKKKQKEAAGMH